MKRAYRVKPIGFFVENRRPFFKIKKFKKVLTVRYFYDIILISRNVICESTPILSKTEREEFVYARKDFEE